MRRHSVFGEHHEEGCHIWENKKKCKEKRKAGKGHGEMLNGKFAKVQYTCHTIPFRHTVMPQL